MSEGARSCCRVLAYPGGLNDDGDVQATGWTCGTHAGGVPVTLSLCHTDDQGCGLQIAST